MSGRYQIQLGFKVRFVKKLFGDERKKERKTNRKKIDVNGRILKRKS